MRGGLKAALEARKAGKVGYIGFTGHKDPRIHLSMLAKPFDWEACQFPVNALDVHYRSFQKQVLPVCLKKKVGAIGMKGFGGANGMARDAGLTAEEAFNSTSGSTPWFHQHTTRCTHRRWGSPTTGRCTTN